jgi:hypothetical protein
MTIARAWSRGSQSIAASVLKPAITEITNNVMLLMDEMKFMSPNMPSFELLNKAVNTYNSGMSSRVFKLSGPERTSCRVSSCCLVISDKMTRPILIHLTFRTK